MLVSVNRKPNNEVELTIEVSPEELRPFLENAAAKLSGETTIPGFRVGKAPYDLVKARVGEMKIYEEALESVVNRTFIQAVKQENLEPVGLPKIQITKIAPGSPLEYKATIALLPSLVLAEYDKVKVKPLGEIEIKEEEIEKVVNEIREMRAQEALVNRPARTSDRVRLDIELFMDSVPLEGGQAKAALVELGKEMYIPGFDAEIVGLSQEAKKEFALSFPSDHGDKKLAGKKVEFRVAVKGVYEVTKPELNDEFARGLGKFSDLTDLRTKVRENIKIDKEERELERQDSAILEQLAEKSEFGAIPKILMEAEIEKMIAELKHNIEQRGAKFDEYLTHIKKTIEDLKNDFQAAAEKRIKTSLVIREVGKKEKIAVEEKEIDHELEHLREYYKDDKDALARLREPQYRDWIRGNLLNRKVIDFLRGKIIPSP